MVNYFQKLYDEEQINLTEDQPSLPPSLAVIQNPQKNGFAWAKKKLQILVYVLVLVYVVLLTVNMLTCKESYISFQLQNVQNGQIYSADIANQNSNILNEEKKIGKQEKVSLRETKKDAEALPLNDSELKLEEQKKTQNAAQIESGKSNQLIEQELPQQKKGPEAKQESQSQKIKEATSLIPKIIKELSEASKKKIIVPTDKTSSLFEEILAIKDRQYNKRKSQKIQQIYTNLDDQFRKTIHAPSLTERQNIINQYKGKEEMISLQLLPENQELNPDRTELDEQYLAYIKSQYRLKELTETNMCVILSTHNNNFNSQINRTLNSIFNQQYKQYQVIITDLSSNDGTYASIERYIEYNQLSKKTTLLQFDSSSEVYALWNALKYCKPGSVAIYIDANTEMIGKQVLSLFNYMYASSKPTIAYSNEFHLDVPSQKLKLYQADKYDQSQVFMMLYRKLASKFGRLFSFKAELIKKVSEDYIKFNEKYFQYTGINSLAVSLLELSCGHVQKIDLPLGFSLKDSQIEREEEQERKHEQFLISDKLKLDNC